MWNRNQTQADTDQGSHSPLAPATPEQGRAALKFLAGNFMGRRQAVFVQQLMRGEEAQFFFDKMVELQNQIQSMPKTGETDGKGDDALVVLHYFKGGADWFITEKDMGDGDDATIGEQHQAFGLADLFQDGGELGYISLIELGANGVELDFHWTLKTLKEVKAKRGG